MPAAGRDRRGNLNPEPNGSPVRHNLFYKRVFTAAVEQALPGRRFRFHDLRHTCAAWLVESGAHPLQIKLRLGHEDIKTTMNTYGHLFPSAEAALGDLLDARYRAAEPPKVTAIR
ncbi:MAG: tyrosine-type recombinase/integrase [Solirubrobacteraceae bacterium]